jgi:hypothetical protein
MAAPIRRQPPGAYLSCHVTGRSGGNAPDHSRLRPSRPSKIRHIPGHSSCPLKINLTEHGYA